MTPVRASRDEADAAGRQGEVHDGVSPRLDRATTVTWAYLCPTCHIRHSCVACRAKLHRVTVLPPSPEGTDEPHACPPPRRNRPGAATVGALVALALVTTAGAPSLITVRPGDTLWELARTHGTSERALRALNELPGNGMIYAGQTLRVSGGGTAAAPASSGRSHRVASGETLSHIALRYGVSQSAIASANGLSGGRIYAGRTLTIPGGGGGGARARRPSRRRTRACASPRPSAARSPRTGRCWRTGATRRRPRCGRWSPPPRAATASPPRWPSPSPTTRAASSSASCRASTPSASCRCCRRPAGCSASSTGSRFDLLEAQDNITAGVLLLRQLIRSEGTRRRRARRLLPGPRVDLPQGHPAADPRLHPQHHDPARALRRRLTAARGGRASDAERPDAARLMIVDTTVDGGVSPPPPVTDPLLGRLLDGRYRLDATIARGGMATVYDATDTRLDRPVAVKVMRPGLADDPEFVERFAREARAAARLSSPEVVAVHDQGTDADTGTAYLVMERVSGGTLRDVLARRAPCRPRGRSTCSSRCSSRWPPRTRPGSCTATSSPRTSCCPTTAA